MTTTTWKYWKFQGRALLTRLGVWQRVESWRLQKRFREGFIHEPDFNFFRHVDGASGLFVDIGANIGQSALSFRIANRTCSILSFEPNPDLAFGLHTVKHLLGDSFDFRMHGFGATTESRRLFVPMVKGLAFPQCATFRRECLEGNAERQRLFHEWTGADRFDIVERSIHVVRFDELMLNPDFVKIDVEGGEMDVIVGMEETLARCRPMLMTEGNACSDFLVQRDYRTYVHERRQNRLMPARGDEDALNFFFIPQEKVPALERLGAVASQILVRYTRIVHPAGAAPQPTAVTRDPERSAD
jgi:FkbM family methyltransferase